MTGPADAGADRPTPLVGPIALAIAFGLSMLAVGIVADRTAPAECGASVAVPPAARSPIQHLFFVIKENHAFENYFGSLPGVIGYPPNGSFPVSYGGNATISPFALPGDSTPDLPHDRASDLADWDGGRNDNFVAQASSSGALDPDDAVGYYTERAIPDYFAYARNYTLADRFFTGALAPTLPNRLFDLGLTNTTWTADGIPSAASVGGPTLPQQLAAAGLPWEYFYSGPEIGLPPLLVPQIADDECLTSHILPVGELGSVLRGSAPPAVAYIDPENDPLYSEHPPQNVTLGEEWTTAVVNQIFSSPIGPSSAVLIWYDEAGGYWDPVAPPEEPPIGDGFRVPLLVLSPWSGGGRIFSGTLDPASLIRFAEQNWGLPALDPRIATASSADGLFNFSGAARPPLELPTPIELSNPYPNGEPPFSPDAVGPTDHRTLSAGAVLAPFAVTREAAVASPSSGSRPGSVRRVPGTGRPTPRFGPRDHWRSGPSP